MDLGFHPVPKPVSRPKDKPKHKEKRPKKKAITFKGRTIPTAKARGTISKKEYERAIESFGHVCVYCGDSRIEMHHIRFRSQQGRGRYRNLIPLCKTHHTKTHTERSFADEIRQERIQRFGAWYWADKYDLFQAGLIGYTTFRVINKYIS